MTFHGLIRFDYPSLVVIYLQLFSVWGSQVDAVQKRTVNSFEGVRRYGFVPSTSLWNKQEPEQINIHCSLPKWDSQVVVVVDLFLTRKGYLQSIVDRTNGNREVNYALQMPVRLVQYCTEQPRVLHVGIAITESFTQRALGKVPSTITHSELLPNATETERFTQRAGSIMHLELVLHATKSSTRKGNALCIWLWPSHCWSDMTPATWRPYIYSCPLSFLLLLCC